jgi:hypothetical protein
VQFKRNDIYTLYTVLERCVTKIMNSKMEAETAKTIVNEACNFLNCFVEKIFELGEEYDLHSETTRLTHDIWNLRRKYK